MLDNGKTSNFQYNTVVTRWKSGKMIGPSSVVLFLLDSIFHPRNERAAFEMKLCYFWVPFCLGTTEISLEFSCGGTFPYPLEVCLYVPRDSSRICHVPLMPIAYWLHQIKFLLFNLYHRFLQWALSTPRLRPSLSRLPRSLRWCWWVYWIVSRRAFSNEIIVNTSAAVFFRICWLPVKLLRLKVHVVFHISSIWSTFEKSNILNHLHWDSLLLGNQDLRIYLHSFCWVRHESCPWNVAICSSHFCL
jgi:hypothetical protein